MGELLQAPALKPLSTPLLSRRGGGPLREAPYCNFCCNGIALADIQGLPNGATGVVIVRICTAPHGCAEATDQKVWGSNPYGRAAQLQVDLREHATAPERIGSGAVVFSQICHKLSASA